MPKPSYDRSVFVNCPFDERYREMFRAIVFTVMDCGFKIRCALEIDDGSQNRMSKIENLIEGSRFGIHDLSRTELDLDTQLPRFNMPLELGLFLGAKRYGVGRQIRKSCLILDTQPFRYQKFISDIAGHDITSHENDFRRAIAKVQDWLAVQSRQVLPGGDVVQRRFFGFIQDVEAICTFLKFDSASRLPFNDLTTTIEFWLTRNT